MLGCTRTGPATHDLLIDTRLLPYPAYQRSLQLRFPDRLDELPQAEVPGSRFSSVFLLYQVADLALRARPSICTPALATTSNRSIITRTD
jgi:hypothetical protein